MSTVVLADISDEQTAAIRGELETRRLTARFARVEAEAAPDLLADGARAACIVLGPTVPDPLNLAVRICATESAGHVIVLAPPEAVPQLRRVARREDLDASRVRLLGTRSVRAIAEAVADAVEAADHADDSGTPPQAATPGRREPGLPAGLLVENAPVGMVALDGAGLILNCNAVAGRILHVNPRAALQTPFARYFVYAERERVMDFVRRCASADAQLQPETYRRLTFHTESQLVQLKATAVGTDTPHPAIVLILQDVTELKHAEEALQQRALQQAAVAELGRLAITNSSLPALLDAAVDRVVQTIHVDVCGILEQAEGGKSLRLRAGFGWLPGFVGQIVAPNDAHTPAGYALATDEPVVFDDLKNDPRFPGAGKLLQHDIVSGMTAIIRGPQKAFGVLTAHSTARRVFTTDDVYFLRGIANVLAAAIERNRAEDRIRFHSGILSQVDDAVVAVDSQSHILYWNTGAERLYGYRFDEVAGKVLWDVVKHRWLPPNTMEETVRTLRAEGTWRGEMIHQTRSGQELYVGCAATLVHGEDGDIRMAAVVRDITARKRAEEAQQFLTSVSGFLASSLDYHTTLASVARLAVPYLADLCLVDLLTPDGHTERVAAAHALPQKDGLTERLLETTRTGSHNAVARAIFRGSPEIVSDSETALSILSRTPEHRALLEELGVREYIAVPLIARSRTLGAITLLLTEPGRRYTSADLPMALDVAGRAALAVNNALLYHAAQEEITERKHAEQALERHQQHIEQLNQQLRRSMKETHHRVKNNLQIIAAMVDMLMMDEQKPVSPSDLRRLNTHVNTLAVVHDLLTHQAQDGAELHHLSAEDVMTQLLPMLQQSASPRQIRYKLDDADLTLRQSTSLALVANELVNNAIKHGNGEIEVALNRVDAGLELIVRDRGPGFPAEFDPRRSANTGLELVGSLSAWDLGGQVTYANSEQGGAEVRVLVPIDREL